MNSQLKYCLHEIFRRQASRTPDAIAVVDPDNNKSMTFKELDMASEVLATNLRHKGIKVDSIGGIYMDKCLEYVIAYIAILKAGGAYLPLDVSYPPALLKMVLEDAEPVAVITTQSWASLLPSELEIIVLDDGWQNILEQENTARGDVEQIKNSLDDLAYVVYSSGTTGKPKGICCPHRGAVFSYTKRFLFYPFEDNDRVACNVFFVWELLRPLLKGITLYIIPNAIIYDPVLLSQFIYKHRITRILFTPSLLEAMLDCSGIDFKKTLSSLRIIMLCGEVVATALRNRCVRVLPNAKLVNLYSTSESHDMAMAELSGPYGAIDKNRKFCPIGKPYDEVHVLILDDDLKQQPVGVYGEIYVGGPTLARGYLKRPELNAKRFIKTPDYLSAYGPILYRAGDWGCLLPDGQLEIGGRCDTMVKVRGYSIELQAVEAALLELDKVNAAVVIPQGEEGSDKFLVAYVVPEGKTTRKEIREALKKRLPYFMIPSYFVFLASVPLLPASAKLDKKQLPLIDPLRAVPNDDEDSVPRTETERIMAKMWCDVLQLKAVDIDESFFDLGGHSLMATKLITSINDRFKTKLSVRDLFTYNTVISMASYVETELGISSDLSGRQTPREVDISSLESEVERYDDTVSGLDIQLRAFWHSLRFSNRWYHGSVLLTGVTGFLGAYLLKEILATTEVDVYCIVREVPDSSGKDRVRANLVSYGLLPADRNDSSGANQDFENAFSKRVYAITGDITLRNLGMTEEEFIFLSYEVDYVIHAGAVVNLIYPYKMLRSANVVGTKNIIKFASVGKIKPLHHISTNGIFPRGKHGCSENDDMIQFANRLTDGYAQSKWVAEQLVLRARNRGLPVVIYRPGNLSGDRDTGAWNPSDFIFLMLKACVGARCAPNIDWQLEMTPVDFASEAIVRCTQNLTNCVGRIYHITNRNTVSFRLVCDTLSQFGCTLKSVDYEEWFQILHNDSASDAELKVGKLLETLVGNDMSFFGNSNTFDNSIFTDQLTKFGLTYPKIDKDLIETYSKYLECLRSTKMISEEELQEVASISRASENQPLRGQVAVITGASSGIGATIAKHLALAGASVALGARRMDRLKSLCQEIRSEGGKAIGVPTDVTKKVEVEKLVNTAREVFGEVTILVNNAGCMYYTEMKNAHINEWERQIDVNCKGMLYGISNVLSRMLANGCGHIVNISSDAGRKVFPGLTVYSGTKFFVEAISQGVRLETAGSGVRVTSIQPGDVSTEILTYGVDAEARKKYGGSAESKILRPLDIANAVVYALTQPSFVAVNEILIEPADVPC
ncbi:Linear gramicidin synthase subunit D [Trichoplax sp. H2]|nr:Linear gramicidin synthase subunit D [Trichoplax sp. H2]|eukprot:RDD46798.1 Linear gramicidin synthase subunit D [Trichoplax sp. H2]